MVKHAKGGIKARPRPTSPARGRRLSGSLREKSGPAPNGVVSR